MKSLFIASLLMFSLVIFGATTSFAAKTKANTNKLDIFVIDGAEQISCQELIDGEEDVQVSHSFQDYDYCYKGESSAAVAVLAEWKKSGYFYSGGGGGFVLRDVEVLRGIYTYDLKLTLEDEVVPGEMSTVIIKPCDVIVK